MATDTIRVSREALRQALQDLWEAAENINCDHVSGSFCLARQQAAKVLNGEEVEVEPAETKSLSIFNFSFGVYLAIVAGVLGFFLSLLANFRLDNLVKH